MAATTMTTTTNKEPKPPFYKVWILACRPHTLTASIAPCLLGHCLARNLLHPSTLQTTATPPSYSTTSATTTTTCSWIAFCVFIQLATNLHNDYADFVKGADTGARVGQPRATQKGWLTANQTATGATVCLVLALAVGLPLLGNDDYVMKGVLLTSCFNAVAYTGGPFPLGYIGLEHVSIAYSGMGDIMCFIYFGIVATMVLPYLAIRNDYSNSSSSARSGDFVHAFQLLRTTLFPALIQALPMGFLSTNILVVNNLRDRHTDVLAHKKTLAVRFGPRFCQMEYTLLLLSSYGVVLWTITATATITSQWTSLLPLLTIPMSIPCLKAIWTLEGASLNPFVGASARLELAYCLLQCIGLLVIS